MSDPVARLEELFGKDSAFGVGEVDALRTILSLEPNFLGTVLNEKLDNFAVPFDSEHAEQIASRLEQSARRNQLEQNLEEAVLFFRIALRFRIRIEGLKGQDAVSCAHELAIASRNSGDFQLAHSLLTAILTIRTQVRGDADPETLMTVNDLAVVDLDLDDAATARKNLTAAIQISTQSLGPQDENTLKLEGNLADALRRLGELKEALATESRVLMCRREALGDEHPEVLDAMNNLAATHLELGQLPEALALQKEVLRLRRKILQRNHPDTMTAMANQAVTLYRMGRFQEALQLERQVLDDRTRVLGPNHPDTWMAANNLSGSLRDIGETAEAKLLLESVLRSATDQLGPDHQYVLLAETNLADAYSKTGEFERAYELASHAWAIRKQSEGLNHPFTLLSEATVAAVLFEMGNAAEALGLQRHVVAARESALGPDHFDTLGGRNDLAKLLWRNGELDRARQIYENVLERGSRVLGQQHPDMLTTLLNLSELEFQLGDEAAARQHAWPIAEQLGNKPVVYGDDYELASRSFALLVGTGLVEELRSLFERVSQAMWNALEVLTHDSLAPLWRHFAAFHEIWQEFCVAHELEDLPKALIAVQGLEVTTGAIEELTSGSPTSERAAVAVARQSLADIRVRIEQLDSQIARIGEEAQTEIPSVTTKRRGQREAERSAQIAEERKAARAYEDAKSALVAAEPALAAALQPPRPSARDLEDTLAPGESLVLVWRSAGAYAASVIYAGTRSHTVLPGFGEFEETTVLYERRASRGRGRRMAFRTGPTGPTGSKVTIFALKEACNGLFWRPLLDAIGDVAQISIVTAPSAHSLPFELGNPGIAARYFTGLPGYCRARLKGWSVISKPVTAEMAIDPAWNTRAPIPFVEAEAKLIGALMPELRMTDADAIGTASATRTIVACHGMIEGGSRLRYPVLLLDLEHGRSVDPSRFSGTCGMEEFYCSACVGGLVSHTLAGDAFGIVSALQLLGVSAVIASPASLPDFYMPIVSTLYWWERRNGSAPQVALRAAKAAFRAGAWPEELIEPIRDVYLEQIDRVLLRASITDQDRDPKVRRKTYALAATSQGWLWPEPQGRFNHERFSRDCCGDDATRTEVARRLSDHLVASRHRLPRDTVEHICGFLTCFG